MKLEIDTERQVVIVNQREISLELLDVLATPDPEHFFHIVEREGTLWAEKFDRKSLEALLV
jgi:hypothetical protein